MSEKDNIHSFSNEVHLEWLNNRMLVVFLDEVIIQAILEYIKSIW